MGVDHIEIEEPFDTKYPTWVVAYCPDDNSFFVTNERHFSGNLKKNLVPKKKLLIMLRIMLDIS